MTTTTTRPTVPILWIDDNGRVACTAHAGRYVAAAAETRPVTPGELVFTPRGSYLPLDAALAGPARPTTEALACETCHGRLAQDGAR